MPKMSLRAAFERYHRSAQHKPATIKDYRTALSHWERLTDNPPIEDITHLTCRDFTEALLSEAKSPHTVAKYTRELQAVLARLGPCCLRNKQGLDILPHIPCFPPVKTIDPTVVVISDDELREILLHCSAAQWPRGVIDMQSARLVEFDPAAWWTCLVCYLATFGSRRQEFLTLPCSDFDLPKKRLIVEAQKDGDSNWKPIPHDLIPLFLEFMSPAREFFFAAPKSKKTLYATWHGIQQAAGIHVRRPKDSHRRPWYGFHELRKTAGTNWAALSPAAGQHMLGHKSAQTFARYYTNRSRVAEKLIDDFPSPALLVSSPPERPDPTPATGSPRLRIVG